MKKATWVLSLVLIALLITAPAADAQSKFRVGGQIGLSVASAGGGSSAGFQIGPMFEALFAKTWAVGTEFNINTQPGTPVEWATYAKYYFGISGSKVKPFVDAGVNLWFYTGGPYFGLRFGGGASIPVARNLYVDPDVVLGPVFATGTTVFYFAFRGGIRYEF
jgi:hypothetical protein